MVEADVSTKGFMTLLQSLICDVTVVVICYDVTVLFTICLSPEREGSPLISWTACCPTGHEVEWPLGGAQRGMSFAWWDKVITLLCVCVVCLYVHVITEMDSLITVCDWEVKLTAVNTWTKALCHSLFVWTPCCSPSIEQAELMLMVPCKTKQFDWNSDAIILFLLLSVKLICDIQPWCRCSLIKSRAPSQLLPSPIIEIACEEI